MSAIYSLVGKRMLRKYTARSVTPVYAAASDVAYVASHLCDVPWESSGGVRDATMTWHTNETVHTEGTGDDTIEYSGLDWNVHIRNSFDAALFCSDHKNEGHLVHANAAVYVYTLPNDAVGKTLESLTARVTSDPYNAVGARIAIYTNSTGVPPTDCSTCRQGSAPVASHTCTKNGTAWTTNDTYADAIAKHTVVTTGTGSKATTSWYPNTESCTFALGTGLVLQKYLFVFVLLENYNTYRGNWVEGCSFIENSVSVTFDNSVTGWAEGDVIDCTSETSSGSSAGFKVYAPEASFIGTNAAKAFVFSAVCNGHKLPTRAKQVDASIHGDLAEVLTTNAGVSSIGSRTSYGDKRVRISYPGATAVGSPLWKAGSSDLSQDLHDVGDLVSSVMIIGRYLLKYVPGSTGNVGPGLTLYSKWLDGRYAHSSSPDVESEVPFSVAAVSTNTSVGSGTTAYSLLQSGDVNDIVMMWGSAFLQYDDGYVIYSSSSADKLVDAIRIVGNSYDPSWYAEHPTTLSPLRYYIPVAVCSSTGMYLLGFLAIVAASSDATESTATGALPGCHFLYATGTAASTNIAGVTNVLTAIERTCVSYCFRSGITPDLTAFTAVLTDTALQDVSASVKAAYKTVSSDGVCIRSTAGLSPVYIQGTEIEIIPAWMNRPSGTTNGSRELATNTGGYCLNVRGKLTSVNGTGCSSGMVTVQHLFTETVQNESSVSTTGSSRIFNFDDILGQHQFTGGSVLAVTVMGYSQSGTALFLVSGSFTAVDGTAYPGLCKITIPSSGTSTVSAVFSNSVSGFTAEASRGIVAALYTPNAVTGNNDSSGLALTIVAQDDNTSGLDIYSVTPYDSVISSDVAAERVCGLRNCYGDIYQGETSEVEAIGKSSGVAFQISKITDRLALVSDGSTGYTFLSIPKWKAVAVPFLIPFSYPDGFLPTKVKVEWGSFTGTLTTGTKFTLWVKEGSRIETVPSDFFDAGLFTGNEDTVNGWTKVGNFAPTSSAGNVTIPYSFGASFKVATFLITAWYSQDAIDYQAFSSAVGVGTVSFDQEGSPIGVESGWKPTLSLLP